MRVDHRSITGLDIGTNVITCVTAESDDIGNISITGVGRAESPDGIREGSIVDVNGVAEAIDSAIEEAESLSSRLIREVFVNISGLHVRGISGMGSVSIERTSDNGCGEISEQDVERAEEAAKSIGFPSTSVVLDISITDYSVDGIGQLHRAPIGLRAEQLSARVYTILADKTAVLNLKTAVEIAGRTVSGIFPGALASAKVVLSDDEIDMGVALADIGAGTTDVAVFRNGSVCHVGSFLAGGNLITGDLRSLRISVSQAEKLKTDWAVASTSMVDTKQKVSVTRVGGRGTVNVSHAVASQIVSQRVEEIFEGIHEEISSSGLNMNEIPAGLVITGGSSQLPGMTDVGRDVVGIPVEVGVPNKFESVTSLVIDPSFSTAIGLVMLGLEIGKRGTGRKRFGSGNYWRQIKDIISRLR